MNKDCPYALIAFIWFALGLFLGGWLGSISERSAEVGLPIQDLEAHMQWDTLILVSPLLAIDVQKYTRDPEWQIFWDALLSRAPIEKYDALKIWLDDHEYSYAAKVQVTNYVHALRRGGLIE